MASDHNTHPQPTIAAPAPGTESSVPSPGKNKWQEHREADMSATVLRGAEEQMSDLEIAASNE